MTYKSGINLNLGEIPEVDDPSLYDLLLNIHNAIELLASATDSVEVVTESFYDVPYGKIVILTDTTANNVNISIPSDLVSSGIRISVRQIAGANSTIISCSNGELVDGASTLTLALNESKILASTKLSVWSI